MENKREQETGARTAQHHFSEETLESIRELGEALREIHNRLISEGYVIANGKISKPGVENQNHAGEPKQRKPNNQGNTGR